MDQESFDRILEARTGKIRSVLQRKAGEYASDNDRLHNFKVQAEELLCSPERALLGNAAKHWASIRDIVDMVDRGQYVAPGIIDEKIGDLINYMCLLEAMLCGNEPTD